MLIVSLILSSNFCVVNYANAQNLPSPDERQMLLKVVDLLEDYQRYSSMDEDFISYGNNFRDLFVSDDAQVFNDILGVVEGTTVSVKDYSELLTTRSSTTRVVLKNITRGDIYNDVDGWKVDCTFDKYVNVTNSCGIEFASDFYNSSDYKLTATIIYDKEADKCLFEKIVGESTPVRTIPQNYRVIKKVRDLDEKVKFNGYYLDFNATGHALIAPVGKPKYSDPNSTVKLVLDNADCNIYHLKLSRKRWHFKFHYDMLNGNLFKYEKNKDFSESKAEEQAYGLDIGYIFPSRASFKVGFFIGAGLTETKIDMSYKTSSYSFETSADVDGDRYTRYYSNLDLQQKLDAKSLSIPVYWDFAIHFNKIVSLVFDAGAKAHYNLSSKVYDTSGSAYVYGIYGSQYDNIRLDENFGYNGFGHASFSDRDLTSDKYDNLSKISVDAFGAAGLRVNIPSTPLALDFNVSYQTGVLNDFVKSPGTKTHVVSNTVKGKDNYENVNCILDMAGNVKRQALKLNMGLIIRL